ncbi:MAG TPA: hypothetical protein VKT73_12720 [Xanthobacteraceae bacterium]|jgi:hypothetical protein|nr:hypothetical protein [Xanthobacteraceae bacterium]
MSPESLQSFYALVLGLAIAGALSTGYQIVADRPASFRLLNETRPRALAAVPFLVFAAPFIILRNTIRGARIEKRGFVPVMAATMIAGFWGLSCGMVVMGLMRAAGFGG